MLAKIQHGSHVAYIVRLGSAAVYNSMKIRRIVVNGEKHKPQVDGDSCTKQSVDGFT